MIWYKVISIYISEDNLSPTRNSVQQNPIPWLEIDEVLVISNAFAVLLGLVLHFKSRLGTFPSVLEHDALKGTGENSIIPDLPPGPSALLDPATKAQARNTAFMSGDQTGAKALSPTSQRPDSAGHSAVCWASLK